MKSYSQAHQDLFVLYCLKNKINGTFLEIGANDPVIISNSYLLESEYGWRGLMIEIDPLYAQFYDRDRLSRYLIKDATKIDYIELLKDFNDIDYLQIDLDVTNGSTIECLKNLEKAMQFHKFGVVTFEHDIWQGDHFNTRELSRDIFKRNGYKLVFQDVSNDGLPYEDWYIHPDLVDINIGSSESMDHNEIVKLFV